MVFTFIVNKEGEFIYSQVKENNKTKVAFFDLDYTLIKPKSGRKFPKDKNDFTFMYDNVIEVLNKYISEDYHIFIISNQNGLLKENKAEKYENMKFKLNTIFKNINIENITIFLACGENYYRKPHSGAFHFYETLYNVKINKKSSFFCGDALGRKDDDSLHPFTKKGDFSASDYYFAINNDLKIYTPEIIFNNNDKKKIYTQEIKRTFLDKVLSKENKENFEKLVNTINSINKQKIIIMNGSPASGKSTFTSYMCKNFDFICCESDILKNKLEKNVEKELKYGNSVIVDATNATKAHRLKYIQMTKAINPSIIIICVYIPYNEELIHHLQHYRIEKSRGLISALPEIALRVYKSKYEKPIKSEGFDYLFEYIPYFTFLNKKDENDFMKYY